MCSHEIHVQTDPEHRDYKVVSGARRKVEEWTPELQLSEKVTDEAELNERRADPIKRLEHRKEDEEGVKSMAGPIERLYEFQLRNVNDYDENRRLRDALRSEKKKEKEREEERKRKGLAVQLLPLTAEEEEKARQVQVVRVRASDELTGKLTAISRRQTSRRLQLPYLETETPSAIGYSPRQESRD